MSDHEEIESRARLVIESDLSYSKVTGLHVAEDVLTLLKELEDLGACRQALEEMLEDREQTWASMHQHSLNGRSQAAVAYGNRCFERAKTVLGRP